MKGVNDFFEKLTYQKVLLVLTFIFVFVGIYNLAMPRKLHISKYYDILNQEEIAIEAREEKDKAVYNSKDLDICKTSTVGHLSEECYKTYFQKYTRIHGPKKGLEFLHYIIQKDPEVIPGCHYISHGIGAGALEYYNNNVGKAYTFDVAKIFTNLGSCANGYYHGVSIGMTEQAKNDDELYDIIYGFCEKRINNEDLGEEACNHGIGHAVTLYYNHDLEKSVAMCRRLFTGPTAEGFFGCITGVRMEYGMYLDYTGLWTEKGASGIVNLCKEYEYNTDEREACIVEGSGVVRYGEDYITAVRSCQTLPTATDRKACTKLTVIHAIRLGRSEQVLELCKIPKGISERVECTAFMANYLATSVDINKREKYLQATSDVCHTLNIFLYPKCISEAFNSDIIIFRSFKDRGFLPGKRDLLVFYRFLKAYERGCAMCGQNLIKQEYSLSNRM